MTCALALALVLAACGQSTGDESRTLAGVQQRLAEGDKAGATVQLKALLAVHPDSAVARMLLGRLLLQAGDAAGAEVELRRALAAGHSRDAAVPLLADALIAQRKEGEVLALLEGAPLVQADASADLAAAAAKALQRRGDLVRARKALDEAQARAPAHAGVAVMQARLLAEEGRMAEAMKAAEALVQRHPDNAEVWLLRADALAQSGSADAAAAYEQVLAIDPLVVEAHAALIEQAMDQGRFAPARQLLDRMNKALPGKGSTLYFETQLAFAEGDLKRARASSQLLLRADPEGPLAQLLAGMIERRVGSIELAHSLLGKALKSMPSQAQVRRELASVLVAQGRGAQALTTLQPNLQSTDADAASWTVAAQAHTLRGDYRAADAAFARARSAGGGSPRAQLSLAQALLARGELERGTRELQAVSESDLNGGAALELVTTLLQAGDWGRALQAAERLATQNAQAPLPHLLRGRALEGKGDVAAARKAYADALQRFDGFLPALERLAELDLAAGKPDAARQHYTALARREPAPVPVLLAIADLERRIGAAPAAQAWLDKAVGADPSDASIWLVAIEIERRLGDPRPAVLRAERAAKALPEHAGIHLAWSQALVAAGEPFLALAPLRRAAALAPQSTPIRLMLAEALMRSGDLVTARTEVDRARQNDPQSTAIDRADIVLQLQEGKVQRALEATEQRRQRMPGDVDTLALQAQVHTAQGQHAAAAAVLREALSLGRRSDIAMQLAQALHKGGDAAAAERVERDWLQAHPKDIDFIGYLAQQAGQRGDTKRAIAHYRRVVELVPDAALAVNNLADLLIPTAPQEALKLALRATALAPMSAPLQDTLAQARLANGDLPGALEAQAAAVRLDPRAASLRLSLARLHLRAGDREKAREQLRQVIGLPADSVSEVERQRLQQEAAAGS
ncbi:MAG: PEP-CTERM system TPR-repeat protein PrsT [Rubrivivax sp.]|nr:PEP-CTERM system TPR-repeat protein PrsT [Rubrivivax sp.]MDP3612700.1 PEP-CTERM system TPR-repeat protein PrsT [Rubrivivax sp.]